MKKVFLFRALLLVLLLAAATITPAKATHAMDVYRDIQQVVYGYLDGSDYGVSVGNWMLQGSGMTIWDFWYVRDNYPQSHYDAIENFWMYP